MKQSPLTFRSITARAVMLRLKRPIVARIMTISDWPLILIDIETEQGVTGRSYVGPYNAASIHYLLPVIRDFGVLFKGQPVAPADLYAKARRSLHLMGYSGVSMVAASALDMAAWDALRRPQAYRSVFFWAAASGRCGPITATGYGSRMRQRSHRRRRPCVTKAASAG